MTLESLIADFNAQDFWLANLWQTSYGWCASIRKDSRVFQYGTGDTPVEALRSAWDHAQSGRQLVGTTVSHQEVIESSDLAEIVAKLTAPVEFKRRF